MTLHGRLLEPLLSNKGLQAKNRVAQVEDISKKYDSSVSKFKEAHAKVAERLESEAEALGEEAIVAVITGSGEYCHQVEAEVYEILEKSKAFKLEVKSFNEKQVLLNTTIPKVKLEYETAIRNFILVRDNAKIVVDPVSEIDRDDLIRSPGITSRFSELYETLKQATWDNVEERISQITPEFDMSTANNQFGQMMTMIDMVIRAQEDIQKRDEFDKEVELKSMSRATDVTTQQQSRGAKESMIKLDKAPNITFSGNARDFSTFKSDFGKIVIPGREDHDIGYQLKQAIPSKHRHLLSNFELPDHKGMMEKLKGKFGTKSLIIMNIALLAS